MPYESDGTRAVEFDDYIYVFLGTDEDDADETYVLRYDPALDSD
jgi:hypothetical protein